MLALTYTRLPVFSEIACCFVVAFGFVTVAFFLKVLGDSEIFRNNIKISKIFRNNILAS